MSKLVIGLGIGSAVMIVTAGVMAALLLIAARRAVPKVKGSVVAMPERVRGVVPEALPPRRIMADLDAIREDTARIRALVEERTTPGERRDREA